MKKDEVFSLDNKIENDNLNYKGYFIENADADEEPKFYEYGAHFPYHELYQALVILRQKKLNMQKGKQIETILPTNKKKSTIRERNNTKNKYDDKKNNLNNILNLFKTKGKSRNIMKEEEKDELTLIHKNNFSQRKKENKSDNNYKSNSNFFKIYRSKIHNIKLNKTNLGKLTENYILTKKKQKKFFNQRIKLFSKNNHTTSNNQDSNKCDIINSYDLSSPKSFQTQIKQFQNLPNKKIIIYPFFNNSKRDLNKFKNSYYKKIINKSSDSNTNKSQSKRILLTNKKLIKNFITTPTPINDILNKNKYHFNKGYKTSKEKKINKMNTSQLPSKKAKLNLIKNYREKKLNGDSNNDNKKEIYISIENGNNYKMEIFNTEKIFEKIKSVKHQIYDVNRFNINKKNNLMLPNINTENQNNIKKIIKFDGNPKRNISKKEQEDFNILSNKNEKNRRNKFNDILKKVSINNFSVNKTIYNKLSKKYKKNKTQQDLNFYKKPGNKNNKNNNKNYIIEQSSHHNSTKKMLFPLTLFNMSNSRNYNSTAFIERKPPDGTYDSTNINLNSLPLKKSNKIINTKGMKFNKKSNKNLIKIITLKDIILKSKSKIEHINDSKNDLKKSMSNSELSKDNKKINTYKAPINIKINNKLMINKYKYNNKNNISININISKNYNNIIYDNNLNKKGKTTTRLNNQNSNFNKNVTEKNKNDKLNKKKLEKLNDSKNENNFKSSLINIKLLQQKFLNLLKSDMK